MQSPLAIHTSEGTVVTMTLSRESELTHRSRLPTLTNIARLAELLSKAGSSRLLYGCIYSVSKDHHDLPV